MTNGKDAHTQSPDTDTTDNPAVASTPDTHMPEYVDQIAYDSSLNLGGTISRSVQSHGLTMLIASPTGILTAKGKT